jgi:hypothetical protein
LWAARHPGYSGSLKWQRRTEPSIPASGSSQIWTPHHLFRIMHTSDAMRLRSTSSSAAWWSLAVPLWLSNDLNNGAQRHGQEGRTPWLSRPQLACLSLAVLNRSVLDSRHHAIRHCPAWNVPESEAVPCCVGPSTWVRPAAPGRCLCRVSIVPHSQHDYTTEQCWHSVTSGVGSSHHANEATRGRNHGRPHRPGHQAPRHPRADRGYTQPGRWSRRHWQPRGRLRALWAHLRGTTPARRRTAFSAWCSASCDLMRQQAKDEREEDCSAKAAALAAI